MAITLTEVQKQAVKKWVQEGASLSDIQKRMASEFQLAMTYIDVRFLVIDLGLNLKEQAAPRAAAPADLGPVGAPAVPPAAKADLKAGRGAPGLGLGGVSVELDRISRPGALVSGTATFSDGVTARWMLDQTGRLALDASQPGYRPSDADVQAFQETVSRKLQEQGF